eukprot:TRINITY_DN11079_c0_g2_i1.p2 TRINITY_DN11079_c0_g2~~TRINITY_DN11079_c0_g2_i1.p2  ORF type:complete len:105 (+),score=44.59 TRINITY_DN11079_c0_g2_i1:50-364(+)
MIRRPPRSTLSSSSAASDVYKRQVQGDVQYVCVSTPNGQLFVPISAPNGQQLLQGSNQMQQQLSADVYRVQSQYHAGGNMSAKEMKKMQKKQGKGGKMKDKKKK